MIRAGWGTTYLQSGAEYGSVGKDEFLRIEAQAVSVNSLMTSHLGRLSMPSFQSCQKGHVGERYESGDTCPIQEALQRVGEWKWRHGSKWKERTTNIIIQLAIFTNTSKITQDHASTIS